MNKFIPFILIFTLLLPMSGKDIMVSSNISNVTIFKDRAEVLRSAEMKLEPGHHFLIWDSLSGNMEVDSARISGSGNVELIQIETRVKHQKNEQNIVLQGLKNELKELQNQLSLNDKQFAQISSSRKFLGNITEHFTHNPEEAQKDPVYDVATWKELIKFHREELNKLDIEELQLKQEKADLKEEIQLIQRKINEIQYGSRKTTYSVVAEVISKGGICAFDLKYRVHGTHWWPDYDVMLNEADNQLDIKYFANIRQNTGEDWNNASLEISTANTSLWGKEPELKPWFLKEKKVSVDDYADPFGGMQARVKHKNLALSVAANSAEMDALPMLEKTAQVNQGNYSVTFTVGNLVTIPSNNQPKRVILTKQNFSAELSHLAIPKISPHTYIIAQTTNESPFPLLAGKTNMFVNGNFVSSSKIEFIAPNESFKVSMGVDENVHVERKEIRAFEEDRGFTGSKEEQTYQYEIIAENKKSQAIDLVIEDQYPISNDDNIVVKLLEPKVSRNSKAVTISALNTIRWKLRLNSGSKQSVPLEYSVSYPKDFKIEGLPH